MNNTTRRLAGIAGALLICVLVVGPASAYDADTACASLKEAVAGGSDLTAIELVAEHSDGSLSVMKFCTESVSYPRITLCTGFNHILIENEKGNDLSQVVLEEKI